MRLGFWLMCGRAALRVGLPNVARAALMNLAVKEAKARLDSALLEDAIFHAKVRARLQQEAREDAKAKR